MTSRVANQRTRVGPLKRFCLCRGGVADDAQKAIDALNGNESGWFARFASTWHGRAPTAAMGAGGAVEEIAALTDVSPDAPLCSL